MSDLTSRSESYMNDLIRRGDVLALFPMNDCSDKMIGLYERVLDIPTAYDVDKVQEEIKTRFGCKDCEYVDEFQHPACNECAELEVINDICDIVKGGWYGMNWNKANRLIFDAICIILIIALPLWILRMIGIEGMV